MTAILWALPSLGALAILGGLIIRSKLLDRKSPPMDWRQFAQPTAGETRMSTTFEVSDTEFPDGLLADVRVTVGQVDFQASVELSGEVSFAASLSEPLRGAVVASVRKYVLDSLRCQFAARDALDAREMACGSGDAV